MVFLYVPNLIGYLRLLLLLPLILFPRARPLLNALTYALSQALDFLDGAAARRLRQCSKFGEVLDQMIDRFSDSLMLAVLATLRPEGGIFFLFSLLDLSSHWFQVCSAALCGCSHKELAQSWQLLRWYYANAWGLLDILVAGNEVFLVFLYLQALGIQLGLMGWLSAPFCLTKQLVSALQLISASRRLAYFQLSKN